MMEQVWPAEKQVRIFFVSSDTLSKGRSSSTFSCFNWLRKYWRSTKSLHLYLYDIKRGKRVQRANMVYTSWNRQRHRHFILMKKLRVVLHCLINLGEKPIFEAKLWTLKQGDKQHDIIDHYIQDGQANGCVNAL